MLMMLTREELDRMRCSTPGCKNEHGPLVIAQGCHPAQGVGLVYMNGALTVVCHVCTRPICTIAVAEHSPLNPAMTDKHVH